MAYNGAQHIIEAAVNPTVSVIMPVYREQPVRLLRAIQSVLQQTLREVELIVVQDDDVDYSAILPNDPRLLLEKTGSVGAGPSIARNIGLEKAKAPYISFLDSDDHFELDKLQEMVPYAEFGGAAFDNTRYGYENVAGDIHLYVDAGLASTGKKGFDFFAVIDKPLWAVYRADLIEGLRYLESIRFSEDSLFNYQAILRNGSAFFCAKPLHNYLIRAESASHGPDSGLRADRAYGEIIRAIDAGAVEFGDLLRPAYARKRKINLEYMDWVSNAWGANGRTDYQTFMQQRKELDVQIG